MPKSFSDEAIILRTHDVGEADRLYVLLTRSRGKILARAHGVRRLLSRRAGSLRTLACVHVTLTQRASGYTITQATLLKGHRHLSEHLGAFASAEQAAELLLAFVEEGENLHALYELTHAFLSACERAHTAELLPVFTLKLLRELGLLPSLRHSSLSHRALSTESDIVWSMKHHGLCFLKEDPEGDVLPSPLLHVLHAFDVCPLGTFPEVAEDVQEPLASFTQRLLGSQLGGTLRVPPVAERLSLAGTPI